MSSICCGYSWGSQKIDVVLLILQYPVVAFVIVFLSVRSSILITLINCRNVHISQVTVTLELSQKLNMSLSLWMSWWPAHIWFVILIKCERKSVNMYCKMLIINLKSEVNLFRSEGSDWLLLVPNRGTDNKVTQGAILDLSKISIAKNEYIFSSFSNLLYIRRSDFGDNGVKMMKIEDKLSKIIWFTC